MTDQDFEDQAQIDRIIADYKKQVLALVAERDQKLEALIEQAKKTKMERLASKFKK